jgi:hypothetical protein
MSVTDTDSYDLSYLIWTDYIAHGLGHFLAVFIHGKPMYEELLIGRDSAQRYARQQRGIEPSRKLVMALQADVGPGCADAFVRVRQGAPRDAAVEPNVENVAAFTVVWMKTEG